MRLREGLRWEVSAESGAALTASPGAAVAARGRPGHVFALLPRPAVREIAGLQVGTLPACLPAR